MPTIIPTWVKVLAGAILMALVVAAFYGYGEHRAGQAKAAENDRWTIAVDKIKKDAARELAAETDKTRQLEVQLQAFKDQQETANYANRETVALYEGRLAGLAARNDGRLRDPNAGRGCGGESPQRETATAVDNRATDDPGAGGLLSVQLSDLLRARLRRADAINIAYAACRAELFNAIETVNKRE